jgi:hypothetical protein
MAIVHILTITASCMGMALTGICLMAGAIGAALGIATALLFVFTAFYGFTSLITDHTGA